jgi:type IV secretion system protein VirD4
MKAMKNYAGHRLSPWLGHLMVSRSETARQLLTPGEIMQLPPTDEIVMVAGTPPIRAKKARYYEDHRFTERVLPPPELVSPAPKQSDDWSALPLPESPRSAIEAAMVDDEDPTQSEHRQQPELSRVNPVEKRVSIENEFDPLSYDGSDDEAARSQRLTRVMRGVARQVSMDPGDGMEL